MLLTSKLKFSLCLAGLTLTMTACYAPQSSSTSQGASASISDNSDSNDHSRHNGNDDDHGRGRDGHDRDDHDCDPKPSTSPSSSPTSSPSGTPSPTPSPIPGSNGQCFKEKFQQPAAPAVAKKLDLLFMADTSGSLNEERGKVAKNIEALVGALPKDLDYRIGVMLMHGSRSSYTGKLYKKGNDPRVLDSKQLSVSQIKNYLYDKLITPPSDYYADGGEEGLYALAVTLDHGPLTSARAQGFFRTDAALAVVMISDENDICAVYPAGVTPVRDLDGLEAPARARDCTRRAPAYPQDNGITIPAHDETITPALILDKLKRLQGDRPLIVSAIAHTTQVPYRRDSEDEYGYGFLDLVSLAKGVAIDILSSDYNAELARLGNFASAAIDLQSKFTISKDNIDPATIHAFVDRAEVTFTFDASLKQVTLSQTGHALSQIEIDYCLNSSTPSPSPSPSSSPTSTPTSTPEPTGTVTPDPTPSSEPTSTPSSDPTPSPTTTSSPDPTSTPSSTPTSDPSSTPTPTPTTSDSPTPTPTPSDSPSPTPSPTVDPTSTPTPTPTSSPTATPTSDPSSTPTATPTSTPTSSPTPTSTPTSTPTPTPTCTGLDCGVFGV